MLVTAEVCTLNHGYVMVRDHEDHLYIINETTPGVDPEKLRLGDKVLLDYVGHVTKLLRIYEIRI